jgi:hypothetical protein
VCSFVTVTVRSLRRVRKTAGQQNNSPGEFVAHDCGIGLE